MTMPDNNWPIGRLCEYLQVGKWHKECALKTARCCQTSVVLQKLDAETWSGR